MAWLKWRGTLARGSHHAYWWERAGKKRRKRSRTLGRDEAAARKVLTEINRNLSLRGVGLPEVAELKELKDKYLQLLRGDGAAPAYVARVAIILDHLERIYPGVFVSEITADLLDDYKVKRREEGIEGTTINREIAALKAAVRKGRRWRFQVNDLSDVTKVKVAEKAKMSYAPSEITTILAKAEGAMRMVAMLGLYAGLRRGEMLELRWRDVDFEQGKITLGDGWVTKTRDARALPLNVELRVYLAGILLERGAVRPQDRVLAWETSPQNLTGQLRAFLRAAGVARGAIHWLRHTFVTALKKASVDTKKVQRMVGHKKETTTDGYTHLEVDDLRAGMAALKYE